MVAIWGPGSGLCSRQIGCDGTTTPKLLNHDSRRLDTASSQQREREREREKGLNCVFEDQRLDAHDDSISRIIANNHSTLQSVSGCTSSSLSELRARSGSANTKICSMTTANCTRALMSS